MTLFRFILNQDKNIKINRNVVGQLFFNNNVSVYVRMEYVEDTSVAVQSLVFHQKYRLIRIFNLAELTIC